LRQKQEKRREEVGLPELEHQIRIQHEKSQILVNLEQAAVPSVPVTRNIKMLPRPLVSIQSRLGQNVSPKKIRYVQSNISSTA
jgi:hypothetical protein